MILDHYVKEDLNKMALKLSLYIKIPIELPRLEHKINRIIFYSSILLRLIYEDEKAFSKSKHDQNIEGLTPIINKKYEVEKYPIKSKTEILKLWIPPTESQTKLSEEEVDKIIFFDGKVEFEKVYNYYDYENGKKEQISLYELTCLILHSSTFKVLQIKGRYSDIYTSSDKYIKNYMYRIDLRQYINILKEIANLACITDNPGL